MSYVTCIIMRKLIDWTLLEGSFFVEKVGFVIEKFSEGMTLKLEYE